MFREVSRKNKQLQYEDCIDLLRCEKRGVLAVNGDDGYPYAMPMNHYYNPDDGCIYFHCGKTGHRLDAIRKSDKVSFCVYEKGSIEDGDWAYTVRSVVVFGRISETDDANIVSEICEAMCNKFTQDNEYIQNEIKNYAKATLILKLIPEHIQGKRIKES